MKFTVNLECIESNSIQNIFDSVLSQHRQSIINYIESQVVGDIDLETYEGGIDNWFGLGSVMLYELSYEPKLEFTQQQVHLTL